MFKDVMSSYINPHILLSNTLHRFNFHSTLTLQHGFMYAACQVFKHYLQYHVHDTLYCKRNF